MSLDAAVAQSETALMQSNPSGRTSARRYVYVERARFSHPADTLDDLFGKTDLDGRAIAIACDVEGAGASMSRERGRWCFAALAHVWPSAGRHFC